VNGLRRRLVVQTHAAGGRPGQLRKDQSIRKAREAEVRDWRKKAHSAEAALEQARTRIRVLEESLQVKAKEAGAPHELLEEVAAVKMEAFGLRADLQTAQSDVTRLEQDRDRLEKELADVTQRLEDVDAARTVAVEELEERNRTGDGRFAEKLKTERDALVGHLQEYVAEVEQVKRDRDQKLAELQAMARAEAQDFAGKAEAAAEKVRNVVAERDESKEEVLSLKAKLAASESELAEMATLQMELMRQCQVAQQDATDNRDMHSSSRGEVMTLSETLKQIQQDLARESQANKDLKTDKEALLSQIQAYEAEVATLRQRSEELHEARIAASETKLQLESQTPTLQALSRLRRLLDGSVVSESTDSLSGGALAPPLIGKSNFAALQKGQPGTLEEMVIKRLTDLGVLPMQFESLRHFLVHPDAKVISYQLEEPEKGYVLLSQEWLRAIQSEDVETLSPALKSCVDSLFTEVVLLSVSLLRASEIASALRQKHETMLTALEKHSQDLSRQCESLQEAREALEAENSSLRERVTVLEPHLSATKEIHTLLLATDFRPRGSIEITLEPEALPTSLAALIQHYFALVTKSSSLEGQLADVVVKNGSLLKQAGQLKDTLREREAAIELLQKETDVSSQTHQIEKEDLAVELADAARLAEQQNSLTSTLEERLDAIQNSDKAKDMELSETKAAVFEFWSKLRGVVQELFVAFRIHAGSNFSSRAHVEEFLKDYPNMPKVDHGSNQNVSEILLSTAPMVLKAVEILQFMYTDASATAMAAQRALDSWQGRTSRDARAVRKPAQEDPAVHVRQEVEAASMTASQDVAKDGTHAEAAVSTTLAHQRRHFEELQRKYGLRRLEEQEWKTKEEGRLDNLRRAKMSLSQADAVCVVAAKRRDPIGKSPLQIRLEKAREAFALARGYKGH